MEIQKEAEIKSKDTKGFDMDAFLNEKNEAAGTKFMADYKAILDERKLLDQKGEEERRLMRSSEIRYERAMDQEDLLRARTKEGTITTISQEAWDKRAEYHRLTGEEIAEDDAEVIQVMIDEYKKTYVGGVKSALQEIADESEDVGGKIKTVTKNAFEDLSDTLADFMVDGEADFASFANSIIKQLLKIQIQAIMTGQSFSYLG